MDPSLREPLNYTPMHRESYQEVFDSEFVEGESAGATPLGHHKADEYEQQLLETSHERPHRLIIFVTLSMFMGYAILVSFQHKLKVAYGIPDSGSPLSHEFSNAVSFLYIGNLIFRLAHNFIFAPIKPRNRVYVAILSMALSMTILSIFVFVLEYTNTLAWVYIAYVFGGIGIGSFESNLLSAITPLGHTTKIWAIIGFPLGFAVILIGGFMASTIGVPTQVIYFFVLACLLLACAVFFFAIPVVNIENNANTINAFISNLKHWREWFPSIFIYCIALLFNMFAVSLFAGIMLYVFNGDELPLFGEQSDVSVL